MLELVGLIGVLMVLIYAVSKGMLRWLAGAVVKAFSPPAPSVMSREGDEARAAAASDHRQTGAQTDQTPAPAPRLQAATLDTCKSLRAHGYSREEARALLRSLDRTLDNNVWAAAAPPPPPDVTPIAGRPYDPSQYQESEPALRYVAPPQS